MTTTQTANYSFVKPTAGSGEFVSVQAHLDDNWDKVDQDMNRFDRQVFSTAGAGQTWNKPARAKRVVVRVVGAGGGSGGCAATGAATMATSGAGGGGGYSEKLFLASALASSETIDVGTGGVAGTAGANNGAAGGTSKFAAGKAYEVNATGGAGGLGAFAAGGFATFTGGAGGTAAGGDLNVPGGVGGVGIVTSTTTCSNLNWGGSNPLAGQAPMLVGTGTGNAGLGYGGGGGGSCNLNNQGAKSGAAGAVGVVVVDTYY